MERAGGRRARRVLRPALAGGFLALVLAGPLAAADNASVRVRWSPSDGPTLAGYRIYSRAPDGPYGSGHDAGLPPTARNGTVSVLLRGLTPDTDYVFAVTAYTTDGAESGLSNEIAFHVPAQCDTDADCADTSACTTNERCQRNARQGRGQCLSDPVECTSPDSCQVGSCDPQAGCVFTQLPEGSACRTTDPCVPGACTTGACVAPDLPPNQARVIHFLAVSNFALRAAGKPSPRLLAHASFTRPAAIDPGVSGALIEIRGAGGQILYSATVPPAAFKVRRHGTLFVYRARRHAPIVRGVSRLNISVDGSIVDLNLAADTTTLAALTQQPRLTWSVELGDACFRDHGLACGRDGGSVLCN
jgi:hypothetical protein